MNGTLTVESRCRDDWVDITNSVSDWVTQARLGQGLVTVYVPHTTCGITLQENADPPLRDDLKNALSRLFPWKGSYGHCEDNAAAHMKAVLMGASVQIPIIDGQLGLGTWQAIYVCDFDGPRRRRVLMVGTPAIPQ